MFCFLHRKHSTPVEQYELLLCCRGRKCTTTKTKKLTLKIIREKSVSRLWGEDRQRWASYASCWQCVPFEMLHMRGVWRKVTEGRSICHQTESTFLSARLREGGWNVSRIQLWWEKCETWEISENSIKYFLIRMIDDYCCEDVYHTRIDGRRGPKRPRWVMNNYIISRIWS